MMRSVTSNWLFKSCALLLILALMPGAVELFENVSHWLTQGHLAHAAALGDEHPPTDPEHGCTPTAHLCGCHASLPWLEAQTPKVSILRTVGVAMARSPVASPDGFWPSVDRPPQV